MADDDRGALGGTATRLAELLLRTGIGGKGSFKSADEIAAQALDRTQSREDAIRWIVNTHTRMAAADGFITGVGGFITMVVAVPANIAGFYLVATRMTAAIAKVDGHDLSDEAVRSAVLLCLTGQDAGEILTKVGLGGASGRIVSRLAKGVSPAILMAVNKAVTFRILTGIGKSTLARLGRGVPLAGGVLGAAVDAVLIRRIAAAARDEFGDEQAGKDA
jgi:EcsC protein family